MDFNFENSVSSNFYHTFDDCDVFDSTATPTTRENGLNSTLSLAQQITSGSSNSDLSYQNPFEENTSAYYNHYQADRTDSNPPPIPAPVVFEASVTVSSVEVEDEPPKAKRLNVKAQFAEVCFGYKPRSGKKNHGKSFAISTSNTRASFVSEKSSSSGCSIEENFAAPATSTVGELTVAQSKTQLDDLLDACRHMRGIPKAVRNGISNSLLAFGLFTKPREHQQGIIQQAKSSFLHRVKHSISEYPEIDGEAEADREERTMAAEADELEKMLMVDTCSPIIPRRCLGLPPTIVRTQPVWPAPVLSKEENAHHIHNKLHWLLVKSNHESPDIDQIQSSNSDDSEVLAIVTPSLYFDDYHIVEEVQQKNGPMQVGTVVPEEMRLGASELPIGTTCTTEDVLRNLDLPSTLCVGISKTPELQEPTLIRLDIVASPLSYNGCSFGVRSSKTPGAQKSTAETVAELQVTPPKIGSPGSVSSYSSFESTHLINPNVKGHASSFAVDLPLERPVDLPRSSKPGDDQSASGTKSGSAAGLCPIPNLLGATPLLSVLCSTAPGMNIRATYMLRPAPQSRRRRSVRDDSKIPETGKASVKRLSSPQSPAVLLSSSSTAVKIRKEPRKDPCSASLSSGFSVDDQQVAGVKEVQARLPRLRSSSRDILLNRSRDGAGVGVSHDDDDVVCSSPRPSRTDKASLTKYHKKTSSGCQILPVAEDASMEEGSPTEKAPILHPRVVIIRSSEDPVATKVTINTSDKATNDPETADAGRFAVQQKVDTIITRGGKKRQKPISPSDVHWTRSKKRAQDSVEDNPDFGVLRAEDSTGAASVLAFDGKHNNTFQPAKIRQFRIVQEKDEESWDNLR